MTPNSRFRFQYVDPDAMTPTVTETVPVPIGWKDAAFSLTRDPKFYSLVEFFKGSFTWYGSAREIILLVKENEGPNGRIVVYIDLNYGSGLTNKFTGLLDLSQTEDLSKGGTFYKISCPIIRNDMWAKFINRRTIPINLQSTTDLDGDARTAVNKFTLPLPKQLIRTAYRAIHSDDVQYDLTVANPYGAVDWKLIQIDEIRERQTLDRVISSTVPDYLFKLTKTGDLTINLDIYLSTGTGGGGMGVNQVSNVEVYIQINSDTPIAFTKTNQGTNGADGRTKFSYSNVLSPSVINDEIRIYIQSTSGGANTVYWLDFYQSLFTIDQADEFADTTTDAYLLKDAFESVLSKIIGDDAVLTSTLLDSHVGQIATMRGKHLRGLLFSSKEMFASFDDLWEAFSPLGFAGLGYTDAGGIEIEAIDDFYDVAPVVFIPNAGISQLKDDGNLIYKKVDVGFSKWSAESDSGLDDIQTLATYNSYLRTIGVDYSIRSTAFMAGLGIEQARRQSINGKDYKLDEELIFIAVKDDGSGGYTPEVGTDFDTITGITNSDTRYNLRHSPANILKRWELWLMQFLFGTSEQLVFSKGEGNYNYTIELKGTDAEFRPGYTEIDGQAALQFDGCISTIQRYTISCAMNQDTYEAIKSNRKKGIAISSGTTAYKLYFIEDLEWQHYHGRAVIQVRLRDNTELTPENVILMEDGNYILQEDGTQIPLES